MKREFNLQRFMVAHQRDYARALEEIRQGKKRSHWMWYIFPQVQGLGMSSTSQFYAIESMEEAEAFLSDPYLGGHITEICEVLLRLKSNNATEVFGIPDNMKLKSSMTLFAHVSEDGSVFHQVLDTFFRGEMDEKTIKL